MRSTRPRIDLQERADEGGQEKTGGWFVCMFDNVLTADLNSNKELYKARQEINRSGPWWQAAFDFSDDRGRDGVQTGYAHPDHIVTSDGSRPCCLAAPLECQREGPFLVGLESSSCDVSHEVEFLRLVHREVL